MSTKNIQQRVESLLAERDAAQQPVWVRAPRAGAVEHYSGLSRGKLYQIAALGRIKTASLKPPGAVRGVKLFQLRSLLDYVESCVCNTPSPKE
ncbi:MAG: hypothetical protein KJ072_25960 [Verrucomicrobia bacterium]|nr:hypothetical protein [Verrucomicrobiota bacterium]